MYSEAVSEVFVDGFVVGFSERFDVGLSERRGQ